MSRTNPSICCSICGRIIYEPLTYAELRRKKYARHISDYYAINENGREEELCKKCYMVWKDEVEDRNEKYEERSIQIKRRCLFHITLKQNIQSIKENGLMRGEHAFICLCEDPNNWKRLVNDVGIFVVDIQAYKKDFPNVPITTWLPESDEICVWGDIPSKYLCLTKL